MRFGLDAREWEPNSRVFTFPRSGLMSSSLFHINPQLLRIECLRSICIILIKFDKKEFVSTCSNYKLNINALQMLNKIRGYNNLLSKANY